MRYAPKASSVMIACLLVSAGAGAQSHVPGAGPWASTLVVPHLELPDASTYVRDAIVALAREQLGRPYVFGGETPQRGFDCSGLVQHILGALGIDVPRTAAAQARVGGEIAPDTAHLRPGDLLIFGEPTIDHIGIYVGEGRFIHASSAAGKVIESPIDRPPAPLIKPWTGGRTLDELLAAILERPQH